MLQDIQTVLPGRFYLTVWCIAVFIGYGVQSTCKNKNTMKQKHDLNETLGCHMCAVILLLKSKYDS